MKLPLTTSTVAIPVRPITPANNSALFLVKTESFNVIVPFSAPTTPARYALLPSNLDDRIVIFPVPVVAITPASVMALLFVKFESSIITIPSSAPTTPARSALLFSNSDSLIYTLPPVTPITPAWMPALLFVNVELMMFNSLSP